MQYTDFALKVEFHKEGELQVRVLTSPAGQTFCPLSPPCSVAELRAMALRVWNAGFTAGVPGTARDLTVNRSRDSAMDPQRLGEMLFRTLFPGEVRSLFDQSRGELRRPGHGLRLKLHLDFQEPEVASLGGLPWELLFRPDIDFLSLDRSVSVVRYLDMPRPTEPLPFQPPLRIGVLLSNPAGWPRLDLALEKSKIEAALGGQGSVKITFFHERTAAALREQILNGGIHVLHFMGHGDFDQQTGQGSVLLETPSGYSDRLTGPALARLLRGIDTLRLVVLNACRTAEGSLKTFDPFAGVAPALVGAGLPAVVAMQYPISDRAAIAFSTALYRRVARGEPLDAAVTEARLAIYAENRTSLEWGTPVLFMRVPEGRVLLLEGMGYNSPRQKDAETEIAAGFARLSEEDLASAEGHFRKALAIDPGHAGALTYLCLCQLAGRPLSSLPQSLADELNEKLERAVKKGGDTADLARLLLGVLRHDVYKPRNLHARGAPSAELFKDLGTRRPTRNEAEALRRIRLSKTAALRFNLGG